MGDEAVVAIPRRLVARTIGTDAMDIEIVGTAFGDDQQGLGAGVGLGGGPDRGSRHHGAGGDARDGFEKTGALHRVPQRTRKSASGATSQGSCQSLTEA